MVSALHPTEIKPEFFNITIPDEFLFPPLTPESIPVGFYIKVNVTDLGGGWATGETHIEIDVIKKIINKMIKSIIVLVVHTIQNFANHFVEIIKRTLILMSLIFYSYLILYNKDREELIWVR
ncbi:MAG: hypothetical protein J7K08_05950 [Thermoplasmata archaeon]|nr:hypothetical protein [Thermoplasmata archaeon]